MSKNRIKLSSRQVEAIEMLKKDKRIFASYNCYLHASTIKSLIKNKIAKMDGHYLVLAKPFNNP